MKVLNFPFGIGSDKNISRFEIWQLWSPFYIRKRSVRFRGIYYIGWLLFTMFEVLNIKNSNLAIFAGTSNILILLIKFTRIDFSIWCPQTSFCIYLNLCFRIMLYRLIFANREFFFNPMLIFNWYIISFFL